MNDKTEGKPSPGLGTGPLARALAPRPTGPAVEAEAADALERLRTQARVLGADVPSSLAEGVETLLRRTVADRERADELAAAADEAAEALRLLREAADELVMPAPHALQQGVRALLERAGADKVRLADLRERLAAAEEGPLRLMREAADDLCMRTPETLEEGVRALLERVAADDARLRHADMSAAASADRADGLLRDRDCLASALGRTLREGWAEDGAADIQLAGRPL